MEIKLFHPVIKNDIYIPPSKSHTIRLIIASAFSGEATEIICGRLNRDISAAIQCVNDMGGSCVYSDGIIKLSPIKEIKENAVLHPGESASVLRFLLPVICLKGKNAVFITEGSLTKRPLSPLDSVLTEKGADITKNGDKIYVKGQITGSSFSIDGDVSSQFISGLMLMLSFIGGEIIIKNKTVSRPYIDMTASVLSLFGAETSVDKGKITVKKCCPLCSPRRIKAEGDWSGAAFFIGAGLMGKNKIRLHGLDFSSLQGDRKILDIIKKAGGKINIKDGVLEVFPSSLKGFSVDGEDIPDLVPILSVLGAYCCEECRIYNISRLKNKESDRIKSVTEMISNAGGKIREENGCLIIEPSVIKGGSIRSFSDHRIIMSAAVMSVIAENEIIIDDIQNVDKSYPDFFREFN